MNRLRAVPPPVLVAIQLLVSACAEPSEDQFRQQETRAYSATDSMGAIPQNHHVIPVAARQELVENSGATMSVEQPGVLFTINDSGNEPVLFALDTAGADRGAWRVLNAPNVDWEAISGGPCSVALADSITVARVSRCLYIADVGDNDAKRGAVHIYQLPEPAAQDSGFTDSLRAQSLTFTYEDGQHDVEAMFIGNDGSVNLVTKRPLRTWRASLRPALIFSIPASAWHADEPVIATLVDSLPIIPGSAIQRTITDASLSWDGRFLAARTYRQVYVMAMDTATRRVARRAARVCNIFDLNEKQGEGITWFLGSDRLLLTSEGRAEPMHVINCPMPQ